MEGVLLSLLPRMKGFPGLSAKTTEPESAAERATGGRASKRATPYRGVPKRAEIPQTDAPSELPPAAVSFPL